MKTGLVLEGGGTRCTYTSGVLMRMLEENVEFDYVIGVSAGTLYGLNYLAKQPERIHGSVKAYPSGKDTLGFSYFLHSGYFLNMETTSAIMLQDPVPIDLQTVLDSPVELVTVITDAVTGEPRYIGKEGIKTDDLSLIATTCSLPMYSAPLTYNGRVSYDGGCVDPIPVVRAFDDGCDRVVVIHTQPEGYVKKPQAGMKILRKFLRKYPNVADDLARRHEIYNDTMQKIYEYEREGKLFLIGPSEDTGIKRLSTKQELLDRTYELGISDFDALSSRLREFMEISK